MEIGNQYVNYATLKNKIREQGKPQIQKKTKKIKTKKQKNKKQKTKQNKTKG